jgi:hypothetical protein
MSAVAHARDPFLQAVKEARASLGWHESGCGCPPVRHARELLDIIDPIERRFAVDDLAQVAIRDILSLQRSEHEKPVRRPLRISYRYRLRMSATQLQREDNTEAGSIFCVDSVEAGRATPHVSGVGNPTSMRASRGSVSRVDATGPPGKLGRLARLMNGKLRASCGRSALRSIAEFLVLGQPTAPPRTSTGTRARAITRTGQTAAVPPRWPIGRTTRCDWISYPLFWTRSAGLGPRTDVAVELRSCDRNRLALRAVDPRPGLPSPRDKLVLRQMPHRCLEVPVTVRALIEQRAAKLAGRSANSGRTANSLIVVFGRQHRRKGI